MTYEYVSDDQKCANALVGKTIKRVFVSHGEHQLVFETDAGDVVWDSDGDCCSETWFADIINFHALLGTVSLCEPVEMPSMPSMPSMPQDGRCRQDSDAFYGMKVVTDKGQCDITYRNSSNGYYGGCARLG